MSKQLDVRFYFLPVKEIRLSLVFVSSAFSDALAWSQQTGRLALETERANLGDDLLHLRPHVIIYTADSAAEKKKQEA